MRDAPFSSRFPATEPGLTAHRLSVYTTACLSLAIRAFVLFFGSCYTVPLSYLLALGTCLRFSSCILCCCGCMSLCLGCSCRIPNPNLHTCSCSESTWNAKNINCGGPAVRGLPHQRTVLFTRLASFPHSPSLLVPHCLQCFCFATYPHIFVSRISGLDNCEHRVEAALTELRPSRVLALYLRRMGATAPHRPNLVLSHAQPSRRHLRSFLPLHDLV